MTRFSISTSLILLWAVLSFQQVTAMGNKSLPDISTDTATVNNLIREARKHLKTDVSLADSLANEAYQILANLNYPEGLVNCLLVLSNFKDQTGESSNGFNYCRRAIDMSEQIDDQELLSQSYNQLYLLYFQRGSYDSATIAVEKSMEIAKEIDYKTMLGRGYQSFGILNSIKGNHSKAIKNFLLSEKYYQELKDTLALALLVGNLGVTFEEAGNFNKALEYMHKQFALSKMINDVNLQGWSMVNIGSVHSMLGSQDSALYYYNHSLDIARGGDDYDLIITNLDNIATYYSATEEYGKATTHLKSALALANESGFDYQNVYVIGHLAENYFAYNKLDSARIFAEEQLALAKSHEFLYDQKLAYGLLSKIYAKENKYQHAYEASTMYAAINDSLYNKEKSRQIEELRESYETEKKDQAIGILQQQKETAEFRRNAYALAGLFIISLLLLLYNRQRLSSRKNRQLLEKEQEVEKMKSNFFSNISHEFRTPLTLILGPIETLIESIKDSQAKAQLMIMRKNANRLLSLINQLLDLSKLESGKLKLVATKQNIIPLVKGVAMSFNTMAEIKNIELTLQIEKDHLEVYFDKEKIETVIINLLSNAFKFTHAGGLISVSLYDSALIHGKEYCVIKVTDNGEGISERDIANIFNRFYQGTQSNDVEGSGIGLALVKELVELHGGIIQAQSEKEKGTTISVRLPIGDDHLAGEVNVDTEQSDVSYSNSNLLAIDHSDIESIDEISVDGSKPILLLIEDNEDVMAYIKNILQIDYSILEACDGEQGIVSAKEHIPDLIVCDVMMPKKDGYEVCSILKQDEKTSHIPLILLTAKASTEDKIQGLLNSADDYLIKPFVPKELEVRIQNLIESRKQLREKYNRQLILMPEEIEVNSIDAAFLGRVKEAINENIGNDQFSVEQLGREVGMSRSQLHRKLHALTNQSASQLITSFRLDRAIDMIQQNAGTISEIAYSVGFSSPSYFNRCFLQEFGCTPTEIKSKNKD